MMPSWRLIFSARIAGCTLVDVTFPIFVCHFFEFYVSRVLSHARLGILRERLSYVAVVVSLLTQLNPRAQNVSGP